MRVLRFLLERLSAARTRSELRALSDRALRDIGLERAQIDALFRYERARTDALSR